MSCRVCEWADGTGSWVDCPGQEGLTHCRDCHASWRRRSEYQHCTGCHETFSTANTADLHQMRRDCADPASVLDKQGRPKLALSDRHQPEGSTVKLWVHCYTGPES